MEISELLVRGRVWYNIPGKTAVDFIEAFVEALKVPESINKLDLSQACSRREMSSSTAMGRGLAFPHPGTLMAIKPEDAFVALAYPRFPVDWKAPDGAPVKAVFMVVSSSRNDHLMTLSSFAKLCGKDEFYAALTRQAPLQDLTGLMRTGTAGKK